jgi:hypothetical protein
MHTKKPLMISTILSTAGIIAKDIKSESVGGVHNI